MWTPQADPESDDMGQSDLGALDLPIAGFAAQVVADLPDVRDTGGRDRMSLRLRPPDTFTGVVPVRQVAPELKKSTAPPGSQSIRLS